MKRAETPGRKKIQGGSEVRSCALAGCGETFRVSPASSGLTRRFCSVRCKSAHRAAEREQRVGRRICLRCGTEFVPGSMGQPGKYCSIDCRNAAQSRKVSHPCAVCGEMSPPTSPSAARKTCGKRACVSEAKRRSKLGDLNPSRRAKPERMGLCTVEDWNTQPLVRCAQCDSGRDLQRHHIVFRQHVRRAGGDENDPRNQIGLCRPCHSRLHFDVEFPVGLLPDSAFEFAAELLGPGPAYEYIYRRYEGRDARLEALKASHEGVTL